MALFTGKQIKWEELKSRLPTFRAKVPGGWFIFVAVDGTGTGLAFYPDPEHSWDGRTLSHKKAK